MSPLRFLWVARHCCAVKSPFVETCSCLMISDLYFAQCVNKMLSGISQMAPASAALPCIFVNTVNY